jgi:hypothetical protein
LSSTATTHPDKSSVVLVDGAELMTVTATTDDNTLTVARGASGTIASAHADNTIVRLATGNADSNDDFTGWGIAAVTGTTRDIRTWSHDNDKEDLLINPRDGAIYLWDKTTGLSARAVELSTVSGAANAPTIAKQIMVSDQGHTFAFGSNSYGTTVQDPLLISFSTYNDPLVWTISSSTSASYLSIGSGSTFVQAVKTKREIVVWTDTSLHTLRYIGYPDYYSIDQISSNITIAGPKAAVATDKVYAAVNSQFSEVIWFYPSETNSLANDGTGENDRYVIYNYGEKVWYYGSIVRTAWIDRGVRNYPISAGGGYLYNHEIGYNDDTSAMASYIESAPMDIGDGDKFTLIQKVIPDLTFSGSLNASKPAATFTIKSRNEPGENYENTESGITTRISTSPVETYTNQLDLRTRGRSFAMKVESSASDMKWRLGSPRVHIRPDGRR